MPVPFPIVKDISQERERQEAKWGTQRLEWCEWVTVLTEEVGEVSQEALRLTFDKSEDNTWLEDFRTELVQVAAVAVAIIEHVDELKAGWEGEDS